MGLAEMFTVFYLECLLYPIILVIAHAYKYLVLVRMLILKLFEVVISIMFCPNNKGEEIYLKNWCDLNFCISLIYDLGLFFSLLLYVHTSINNLKSFIFTMCCHAMLITPVLV